MNSAGGSDDGRGELGVKDALFDVHSSEHGKGPEEVPEVGVDEHGTSHAADSDDRI